MRIKKLGMLTAAVAAVVLMLAVIICAALPAFAAWAPTQDGVYEVSRPDGTMWSFPEFVQCLTEAAAAGRPEIAEVERRVRAWRGPGALEDDFSIVKFAFPC